jgi:hypothetical protein
MSRGIPRSLGNCGINPYEKPLAHSELSESGNLDNKKHPENRGRCGSNSGKLVPYVLDFVESL